MKRGVRKPQVFVKFNLNGAPVYLCEWIHSDRGLYERNPISFAHMHTMCTPSFSLLDLKRKQEQEEATKSN